MCLLAPFSCILLTDRCYRLGNYSNMPISPGHICNLGGSGIQSTLGYQAWIQTGLHRFKEIGQIFQKTQNRGKYNFREWKSKNVCLRISKDSGSQTLVNRSSFFLDPRLGIWWPVMFFTLKNPSIISSDDLSAKIRRGKPQYREKNWQKMQFHVKNHQNTETAFSSFCIDLSHVCSCSQSSASSVWWFGLEIPNCSESAEFLHVPLSPGQTAHDSRW